MMCILRQIISLIPPHRPPKKSRGLLISSLALLPFLLLLLSSVDATEIRQVHYFYYKGERLSEVVFPQFVICDDCPQVTKLIKSPKNPLEGIGIKWGTDGEKKPMVVASSKKELEEHKGEPKKTKEYKMWQESVLFPFNSYKLMKSELDHLDRISKEGPEIISIVGYTCDIGSSSYNLELSKKRAAVVAEYLKSKGLMVDKIEGKGECCPVSKEKRLNRRVELTLQKEVHQ